MFKEGEIFRLLGIPMGFNVIILEKWRWVIDRLGPTLEPWKGMQLNMPAMIVVLKHIVIPTTIYFLPRRRPSNLDLKSFDSLCRNFLWSGDEKCTKSPKFCGTIVPVLKRGEGLSYQILQNLLTGWRRNG